MATLINFVRIKFASVVADVWLKEMSLWEVMESPPASKLVSEAEAVEYTVCLGFQSVGFCMHVRHCFLL